MNGKPEPGEPAVWKGGVVKKVGRNSSPNATRIRASKFVFEKLAGAGGGESEAEFLGCK